MSMPYNISSTQGPNDASHLQCMMLTVVRLRYDTSTSSLSVGFTYVSQHRDMVMSLAVSTVGAVLTAVKGDNRMPPANIQLVKTEYA
eukprot:3595591-Amphidinium_carterae.2